MGHNGDFSVKITSSENWGKSVNLNPVSSQSVGPKPQLFTTPSSSPTIQPTSSTNSSPVKTNK
ncbi:MAG: hypothetical protein OCD02_11100 [Spirochaetaceae bacterium]